MPVYEYECKKHGRIDVFHNPGETKTHCPICNGEVQRAWSKVGIAFKGDGFYKNDSRGKE